MSDSPPKLTLERPVTPIAIRLNDPMYEVPLAFGESAHLGYIPISEERAFETPEMDGIPDGEFYWPRPKLSCEKAISLIRKFVWANDSFFMIPKPNDTNPRWAIYEALVAYTDNIGHSARIAITLRAVKNGCVELIVLGVSIKQGHSRAFDKFYRGLKNYIKSRGNEDPQIDYALRRPFPSIPELRRDRDDTFNTEFETWPIVMPTQGLSEDQQNWLYSA